jgi:plasmid stabilization system protein ParE
MADKTLEIHDDALAELKSALRWYLERSESAAAGFVAEIDRAIERITAIPARWPSGELGKSQWQFKSSPSLTATVAPTIGKNASSLEHPS